MSFSAKVKNVLSGDTLVLVPSKTNQVPAQERVLTLSNVRSDDSFEAKEYLRQLVIGKEIKFHVDYKNPTSGREHGDVRAPIFKSLVSLLLSKGLVKLKDNFTESDGDLFYELSEVQNTAKLNNLGVWNTSTERVDIVPLDDDVVAQSKTKPIKIIVEKVISGDRVMARLIVSPTQHITTPLLLGGIKSPRTDDPAPAIQKAANEAKQFVEEKLLTTKAELTATLIGESQSGVPIAMIHHPSGNNIHQKLLELGLGEVVDWQSTLIGSSGMTVLRRAEQTAKALGKGIFAAQKPTATIQTAPSTSSLNLKVGATLENVSVARVISGDTLLIRLPNDQEHTVQLASIRGPRPSESTLGATQQQQQALIATVREFVRNQVIGKSGTLSVDGFRDANKDLGFDSRFMVSFKYGTQDLSELLVKKGYASVVRHSKATSGERSLNWDKLVEIEEESKKAKVGIFNIGGNINKLLTVGTRIVDASENATKSRTFLNGFQQKGRTSGYHVEYVNSVNRVKLFNPKEGLKLTLILGGLSNERAANDDGLKFLNKKLLQRNVEFEVYDADRTGGFIGNVFVNQAAISPIQVTLLEQGYVRLHDIAVNSNPSASELIKAEEGAKSQKKGLWATYKPQDAPVKQFEDLSLAKPEFFDVEVVDVSPTGVLSFQYSSADGKFKAFKKEFNDFHLQIPSASQNSTDLPFNLNKAPKKGDLVSAKFAENGKYYRARVLSFDKVSNKYEVKHLDFGNVDSVRLTSLRLLPSKFGLQTTPPFANTATLQNLVLPPRKSTDYLTDAIYALEDLVFDKKLVISALKRAPGSEADYEAVLYDSEKSLKDPTFTINKSLVESGWAIVDTKVVKPAVKDYVEGLLEAQKQAKKQHLGCWEFGDISFEDEE